MSNFDDRCLWKRFFAYTIDVLIFTLPFFLLVYLPKLKGYYSDLTFGLVTIIVYYILFPVFILFKDTLFPGQSIGKFIFKIQIVDKNKKPVSLGKSIFRNVSILVPLLNLVEFVAFFTKRRIGDRWAKTYVIKIKKKPFEWTKNLIIFTIILSFLVLIYISIFTFGYSSHGQSFNSYVILSPSEPISKQELTLSRNAIETRLHLYGFSRSKVIIENSNILVEIHDSEINTFDVNILTEMGKFEAKVGDTVVFKGGDDITYVCRNAQCSGIDSQRDCTGISNNETVCSFRFDITVSPESAQRLANATRELNILYPEKGRDGYLSENITLFLDDEMVDELRIGSELKGNAVTDISISGSGSGENQETATIDALNNMKKLQTVLVTGSLPVKFEITDTNIQLN